MRARDLLLGLLFAGTAAAGPGLIEGRVGAKSGLLEGKVKLEHHSKGVLDGGDVADRGIVVVAGGAVHMDSDSDGLLDAGETVEYEYTVINVGNSDLTGIAVSDSLGAVGCPGSTLSVGAHFICTRTYSITATDATAGAIGNSVEVVAQDAASRPVRALDALLTRNQAGQAGIRVFKSPNVLTDVDASNTVTVGDMLRYTFVVKNDNAASLSQVTLTEPDTTRIDTPISCAASTLATAAFAGNGSGVLAGGDVVLCQADYEVRSSDITANGVRNLVEAEGTAAIEGVVQGTGTSLVQIPVSDIRLAKALMGGGPTAQPGELLTYSLTLTAAPGTTGRSFAAGTLAEVVPANTSHVQGDDFTCVTSTAGSSCSNTAAFVVPDGGSVSLEFTVMVAATLPSGVTSITNAAVPPSGAGCDPVAGCDEQTTIETQADLAVLKTGPAQINRGSTLVFTIRVENRGPHVARNARLIDPTPTGLVFVSTSGACSGAFPCALGDMPSGDVRTLTATYNVPLNYAGPNMIVNTVTATSDSVDPTPGDSASTSSVLVPSAVVPPMNIPVNGRWALMLLAIGVMVLVLRRKDARVRL